MSIPFAKYSGCGNDFILIDNRIRNLSFPIQTIQRLCNRQQGIGADGLIFLETSHLDGILYRMRIFNADGSEAEMCGNGLRCLAHYIRSIEQTPQKFRIETMHQQMEVSFNQDLVNVSMPSPSPKYLKTLAIGQKEFPLHCIDTGVPHAVLFVEDIEQDNIFDVAPTIRFHQEFQPKGTNVNFAKVLPDQSVAIRTYERGVEQETLSCGTGAVAAAIISASVYQLKTPITIRTRSNDCLSIDFKGSPCNLKNLQMTGPAIKIFEGSFQI